MPNDISILHDLNIEIGKAETRGDREWLDKILAPTFAFQRADGTTFEDRKTYLEKVARSGKRRTEIESIAFYGKRAVVSCIVTLNDLPYSNVRLFIKQGDEWKLLGWANEPREAVQPAQEDSRRP